MIRIYKKKKPHTETVKNQIIFDFVLKNNFNSSIQVKNKQKTED